LSVPVLSRLFAAQGAAGAFRRPSAGRTRAAALAVASSGSRAAAPGFRAQNPGPNPQSQSFSRSYGSILPTSLIYIVLSTRGCSPWRPDAVMSTTWQDRERSPGFSGAVGGAPDTREKCGALPAAAPYLRMIRFQGGRAVKKKRELFPGPPPASPGSLTLPSAALSR
jgi:hypothetical protein